MDVTRAILYINPNAKFQCRNNDYGQIEWDDLHHTGVKPTLSEVEAAWAIIEAGDAAQAIIDARCTDRQSASKPYAKNIPNWATWTQEQFQTWCDSNLMTDTQVDATSLSTQLKTNIKANNAFTRNSGKMLIALRDGVWPDLPE